MSTPVTQVLKIEGMHCSGCEIRLERELSNLKGVVKVEADYIASEINIIYDSAAIELHQIVKAIAVMDYRVQDSPGNSDLNEDRADHGMPWQYLMGIAIIFVAAYLILNRTAGFGFLPQIDQSMGYGLLFIVGMITSLHCVAMCGGINISQSVGVKIEEIEVGPITRMKPGLLYNLGRVISYTVIGGLAGALGAAVALSGAAQGAVAIAAGLFMAIMGLSMLNIFPGLRKISPRLPKRLSKLIDRNKQRRSPLYVGLLNGLMPCGPLQAMQLYALGTGSALAGALSMMVFSLGTVPMMLGLGAVCSFLSGKFKHRMLQASGVLLILLGIIMLSRGMNLSGISPAYASGRPSPAAGHVAKVDGKMQIVKTTLEAGRYTPIFVQKDLPVQWTITASDEELNGCNNPITIPKYNIRQKLVAGDNLIEFTPREEGTITYTCWMGMISSTINVVSDLSTISSREIESAGARAGSATGAGCCRVLPSNSASGGISPPGCCKPAAAN
jgi:sulfite exporter TauE/SafE/copper chaperone CopZ